MNYIVESLLANLYDELPTMYAHMPGTKIVIETDWQGMVTDYPDVYSNGVYEAHFSEENVKERVKDVLAVYATEGHLPMAWFLTPTSQPENLSEVLLAAGFKYDGKATGMFLNLDEFNRTTIPNSRLTISQVSNSEQLYQWLIPVQEGSDYSNTVTQAFFELFSKKGFEPDIPWKLFLGTVDGKPVSASRLYFANGIAGIYDVATISSARGKGYGTEITIAPLMAAKALHYKTAALIATPLGYNVYRHLGFQDCCFVEVYISPEKTG